MEHSNTSLEYFWTSLRICIAITVGHSLTIFTVTGTFTGNSFCEGMICYILYSSVEVSLDAK